jgi:tryptophan 2,3-dioxygenase
MSEFLLGGIFVGGVWLTGRLLRLSHEPAVIQAIRDWEQFQHRCVVEQQAARGRGDGGTEATQALEAELARQFVTTLRQLRG